MRKLMNILMLSCRRASELIDKQSVVKLGASEKLMLRMHTSICHACTSYQKQSKMLDDLLIKHIHPSPETQLPPVTNAKLKERIIDKIETAQ